MVTVYTCLKIYLYKKALFIFVNNIILVLQIYGVFYRDPEIGFKLFFLTDSCSQDLAFQESE